MTDIERQMLMRLGTLTGLIEALAGAILEVGVYTEWIEDMMMEVKKTDELVKIWSVM